MLEELHGNITPIETPIGSNKSDVELKQSFKDLIQKHQNAAAEGKTLESTIPEGTVKFRDENVLSGRIGYEGEVPGTIEETPSETTAPSLEKSDSSSETNTETEEAPKSNRNRRVYRDKYERDVAAERNARMEAEHLAYAKEAEIHRLNQLLEQERHQKAAAQNEATEVSEAYLLRALEEAREAGDIKTEKEALDLLTKSAVEKAAQSAINKYIPKETYPQYTPQYANNPYPQDYYQPPQYSNPALEEWIYENPWADSNSPNYSPELVEEADLIAGEFNKMLKKQGNAQAIGTREYYEVISKVLDDKYGPPEEAPTYTEPVQTNGGPKRVASRPKTYAPVNSGGAISIESKWQQMKLSPEEMRYATKLPLKDASGRDLSDAAKIAQYKQRKFERIENRPQE